MHDTRGAAIIAPHGVMACRLQQMEHSNYGNTLSSIASCTHQSTPLPISTNRS